MTETGKTLYRAGYVAGRNDAFLENGFYIHPEADVFETQGYRDGYRQAMAELRLDADTQWDQD